MNDRPAVVMDIAIDLGYDISLDLCDEVAAKLGKQYDDPDAVELELVARGLKPTLD